MHNLQNGSSIDLRTFVFGLLNSCRLKKTIESKQAESINL